MVKLKDLSISELERLVTGEEKDVTGIEFKSVEEIRNVLEEKRITCLAFGC